MADNPRIDNLRRRVQEDPASIAFAQLAEEYRRNGQYSESVEVCRNGLARHPGFASAKITLGRALIKLGRVDDARQELTAVLQTSPANLAALRALAEVHQQQGELAEALARYRSCLALAPNDPDLDNAVSDLTAQLEHGTHDASPDSSTRVLAAMEQWLAALHVTRALSSS